MKDIARMALQPGMEIGDDVYSYKGELIIPAGTKVDSVIIAKLTRHSIMCVPIKEEIDYAVTHFEKVRLSKGFSKFQKAYSEALPTYKAIMLQFVFNNVSFHVNDLMQIYQNIYQSLDRHEYLLDYLYNMLPSEDELTYAHCLNSALIAGLFSSWFSLSAENAQLLIQCAFLYDIGK